MRFSHCDPAGIVYYPEFFNLQHAVMEDWFRDRRRQIAARDDPRAPGRHTHRQHPMRLRQADVDRRHAALGAARAEGRPRFRAARIPGSTRTARSTSRITQTIVFMDLDRQVAVAIPEDLRPRIEAFLV